MLLPVISRVALAAAAALFLFLVIHPHRRAAALLRTEEAALRTLRVAARDGLGSERVEGGYRFFRVGGGASPPLFVAAPEAPGESAVRTFATCDGTTIYEQDPVVFRSSGRDPDEEEYERLRRYLTAPPEKRQPRERPLWWHPLPR